MTALETTSEKEAKEEKARIQKTLRRVKEGETDELLAYMLGAAAHSFIYPMFAFAAYTGARRSEIMRSEVDDFRLDEGYVLIRKKKRCRDARTSYRDIVLHPRLKEIMAAYPAGKPSS